MNTDKPYSPACDRNKEAILEQMARLLDPSKHRSLLEIGSGTGQHAVFMAPQLSWLTWTTSEVSENIPGLCCWLNEFKASNIQGPINITLGETDIPNNQFDVVFSANVLHIISWELCLELFRQLGNALPKDALVIFYGPFLYNQQYTSPSNASFDQDLRERDPRSGIRNLEDVELELRHHGFTKKADIKMPANNQLIQFIKS